MPFSRLAIAPRQAFGSSRSSASTCRGSVTSFHQRSNRSIENTAELHVLGVGPPSRLSERAASSNSALARSQGLHQLLKRRLHAEPIFSVFRFWTIDEMSSFSCTSFSGLSALNATWLGRDDSSQSYGLRYFNYGCGRTHYRLL